jgi:hypothetical protein
MLPVRACNLLFEFLAIKNAYTRHSTPPHCPINEHDMRQTSPTFTGSESIISLVLRYLPVPRLGLALEVPTQWTCGLRSVLQQARAPLATAHLLPRARDLLQSRRHVSQKRCYAAIVPGATCMHTHHGPTAHFIFSMVVEHVLPGRADEPRISRSHVSSVRIRLEFQTLRILIL